MVAVDKARGPGKRGENSAPAGWAGRLPLIMPVNKRYDKPGKTDWAPDSHIPDRLVGIAGIWGGFQDCEKDGVMQQLGWCVKQSTHKGAGFSGRFDWGSSGGVVEERIGLAGGWGES